MKSKSVALPVATVVLVLLGLWYLLAIALNAAWAYDQAGRDGVELGPAALVRDTWSQERPRLPAPHQIAAEVWKTTAEVKPSSKRSLIYHGWVTLAATLTGFGLGAALGVALAIAIVHDRTMDASVMPWVIASQTIPILAIAPMIVVVLNSIGMGDGAQGADLDVPVVLSGGGGHGQGCAAPTGC